MKHFVLLSMFAMLLSGNLFSQTHDLPQPMMSDDKAALNPPPPGLVVPIDEGTHWLAAAGVVLGIVLLKKKKD